LPLKRKPLGAIPRISMRTAAALLTTWALVACARAETYPFSSLVAQCDRRAADSLMAALRIQQDAVSATDVAPTFLQPGLQRYPKQLRRRGIGGRVEFEYVVRVDGTVDPCTVRALTYTNEGFILSGSDMLAASRFSVPLRNGVPSPTLMRQVVTWRIAD
jgi:hypothetical protein